MGNRRKWNRLAALALSAALLIPTQAVYAGEGRETNVEMETHAEGREADANGFEMKDGVLVKYTGTATEVVIPAGVTSIGDRAFADCSSLTSIEIPNSVTSIGDAAFDNCSSLANVVIPSSVTDIGGNVFNGTEWLEKKREENPFVIVNNILIDGKVCKGEVAIPAGVMSIGSLAFAGCHSLTSIAIPNSVTNIGRSAFASCSSLTSIEIPNGVTSIGDVAFSNCSNLTSVKIPNSVTNIGYSAFRFCNKLTSIKIPNSMTSIGVELFYGCKSLASVEIPNSVTSIGDGAFHCCYNLTSLEIPNSVVSIGDNAFLERSKDLTIYGMPGSYAETYAKQKNIKFAVIGKKTIADKDVTISPQSYAYDGKAKKPAVTVRDGNKTLKAGTDYDVAYQNNVNAGTAKAVVKGKGNYQGTVTKAFTIAVRNGTYHTVGAYQYQVTSAGTASVTGAADKKIARIKIPGTVTIGGKRFQVTAIGKNAFRKNTKATSVEIANSVKIIGTSSFEGCTKLTKVTVGKGVTEIGGKAFKGCRKLGRITIKSASLNKVGKNALKGIKGTARIKVPSKKLVSYRKLFKNKGQGRKVKVTR